MNIRKQQQKLWYDRRSRLGNSRKHSRNRYGHNIPAGRSAKRTYVDNHPRVIMTPPTRFSLTNNPEETMEFFQDFAREIDRKEFGTRFYIDSKNVESATVDALIFLIAILQNDAVNILRKYSFSGNYPENDEARQVYAESGFNDYVVSKMKKLPASTEKMKIICGTNNDPSAAKDLCDFIITNLGKTRKDILPIQKVLIELMSNVYHHAYEKNSFMAKKWYMYAEYVENRVRCVFVDTGFGIAKTARKNFSEKIRLKLGIKVNDARIIQSIFEGDFRTATGKHHRGNGLASVRENVTNDLFEGLEVFSGRGRCVFPKDSEKDEIIPFCYDLGLYGTLYQFVLH